MNREHKLRPHSHSCRLPHRCVLLIVLYFSFDKIVYAYCNSSGTNGTGPVEAISVNNFLLYDVVPTLRPLLALEVREALPMAPL